MKALILAGGYGKRLRPITEQIPKPMLPVINKPTIVHIIEYLASHGINEIRINLHHLSRVIEDYLEDGSHWGVQIRYIYERRLLGTAGAVKRLEPFFDEPFVVIHGCLLTTFDLSRIIANHQKQDSLITRLINRPPFHTYPPDGNQSPNVHWPGVGLYVMSPEIFQHIPAGEHHKIELELIPKIEKLGRSHHFHNWLPDDSESIESTTEPLSGKPYPLIKIRELYDLLEANRQVLQGQSLVVKQSGFEKDDTGLLFDKEPAAEGDSYTNYRIVPPVLVGGPVNLDKGAVIEGPSVIGKNCRVGENVTIKQSLVLAGTHIMRLIMIKDAIVSDSHIIEFDERQNPIIRQTPQIESLEFDFFKDLVYTAFNRLGSLFLFLVLSPGYLLRLIVILLIGPLLYRDMDVIKNKIKFQHDTRIRPEKKVKTQEQVKYIDFECYMLDSTWAVWHRFPELLNVARGDMNLVGHRPITPNMAERLDEEWQFVRFRGYPGWISPWEVQAGNEFLTAEQRNIIENNHALNPSIRKDLTILLKAIFTVLFRRETQE